MASQFVAKVATGTATRATTRAATHATAHVAARRFSEALVLRQAHATRELLVSKWRLQRLEVRRLLLQVLSGELLTFTQAEQAQAVRELQSELVDYVSNAHFRIYGRILPRKLSADLALQDLLQHIFQSIGKSTDAVLQFNARFQHEERVAGAAFRQALIRLSRGLLLRFALEEQLLELCGH